MRMMRMGVEIFKADETEDELYQDDEVEEKDDDDDDDDEEEEEEEMLEYEVLTTQLAPPDSVQ